MRQGSYQGAEADHDGGEADRAAMLDGAGYEAGEQQPQRISRGQGKEEMARPGMGEPEVGLDDGHERSEHDPGNEIEEEAKKFAPCDVGKAIVTSAGKLKAKKVIHAPTMKNPAEKITVENVKLATRGILSCAEENGIKEIAIPGLGTGVGGVSEKDAAKAIVEVVREYETKVIEKIVLIGFTDSLYQAFLDEIS